MHINYEYLLEFSKRNLPSSGARILDYGCGAGEVVKEGRRRGFDIYGAELFYEGGNTRSQIEKLGYLGTIVSEIIDDKTMYPDAYFDLILNNQVLEHVENLDAVLEEFDRILKPGGRILSIFPTKEVWWEGHRLIPLLHWFPKDSAVRVYYAYIWRLFGGGAFKDGMTKMEWARYSCDWIDKYTFYRSEKQVLDAFSSHFSDLMFCEKDYLAYRLKNQKPNIYSYVKRILHSGKTDQIVSYLVRRRGGLVLVSARE